MPLIAGALSLALAAAGCASSGSAQSGSGGSGASTLAVANVLPLSGALAQGGSLMTAACDASVYAVNTAGGVLGHKLQCVPVDDTGDPADAVPNLAKALATNRFSLGVGLESNTAAVTEPLMQRAGVPSFTLNGLSAFDRTTNPYFWRTVPDDEQQGAAFAIWAMKHGARRIAVVLENNAGASGNTPGILKAVRHFGGQVVADETLPAGAPSYASVVAKVIRARPQVIITATDPQTAATFFGEYSQQNAGIIPDVVTGTDSLGPEYFAAVKGAIGSSAVVKHFSFVGSNIDTGSGAYAAWRAALTRGCQCKDPSSVLGVGVTSTTFDGVVIASLAMTAAHSTAGSVYDKFIPAVTSSSPGAVKVSTYQQGVAALKAGKRIDYVGVEGQFGFNPYHNSPGSEVVNGFDQGGQVTTLGHILAPEILAAVQG